MGTKYAASMLDPDDYNKFAACFLAAVMVLSGLTFESLCGIRIVTVPKKTVEHHLNWRFAKACFPLGALASIEGCFSQEAWSIIVFTVCLFKFGFPEITVYFKLIWTSETYILSALNGVTGLAMLLHHVSTALAFSFIYMNATPHDQHARTIGMCAVAQHMCTTCMDVANIHGDIGTIIWYISLFCALTIEIETQVEVYAYIPCVGFPICVALVMFSVSHLMCLVTAAVCLLRYKSLQHFYCAPEQDKHSVDRNGSEDDAANDPESGGTRRNSIEAMRRSFSSHSLDPSSSKKTTTYQL